MNLRKRPRICFINPPYPYLVEPDQQAQIGLLYLVAVLERFYNVQFLNLANYSLKQLNELSFPPADIYGITACYPDYPMAYRIAVLLKQQHKSVVILGGPLVSSMPDMPIDCNVWDSIIVGEGETTMFDVILDWRNGNLRKIYRSPHFLTDIDLLPFPERSCLTKQGGKSVFAYRKEYYPGGTTVIITSRGCPYNCAFCASAAIWHRNVRYRRLENVISEIENVIDKYGIRQFRFNDDTMTINKKRIIDLCDILKYFAIAWRCSTRVDSVNPKLLEKMREAGCREISYGVESADQNVLDVLEKNTKVEAAKTALKWTKEAGMTVRILFMIGTPGEGPDTWKKNIEFLENNPWDIAGITTFVPFPGSPIWKEPYRYGTKILTKDFDKYNFRFWQNINGQEELVKITNIIDTVTESQDEMLENKKQMRNYILSTEKVNKG